VARKLIIDLDPGIGDAVAAALALVDSEFDVLALTATAGVVWGNVATRNLHAIVAQVDPPKWPRIGSAPSTPALERNPSTSSRTENKARVAALNGPTGLGNIELFAPELHHRHESWKVLVDTVKAHPHEVTLLTLGPLTNVAAALERAPEFIELLRDLVCLGGSMAVGGDITAAAETNVYLDPEAAQCVLGSPAAKTIIPLDATNDVVITFENFNRISTGQSPTTQFVKQLLPFYFRAHHQFLGMEGIWLREVAALAAVARPGLCRSQPMPVDVEIHDGLTCGTTVFERRRHLSGKSGVSVALEVDPQGVVDYMTQLLR
jgi:inosine-uridine nucleoside N-ribohydrolase